MIDVASRSWHNRKAPTMNARLRRLAALAPVAVGAALTFAPVAGAVSPFPDGIHTVPSGCEPIVSFQHPTVSLGGECAPLTMTVIVDDHDAASDAERLSVTTRSFMNGDPLPLPTFDGCHELQLDLFQGAWTVEMLHGLEESASSQSPGAWLWTAALILPEGRPVPAQWQATNAVIRIPAGDCDTVEVTTTTAPAPTTSTTAPAPTTSTVPEPTTTLVPQPTPTLPTPTIPPTVDVPLDAPPTTTTEPEITYTSATTPISDGLTELPFTGVSPVTRKAAIMAPFAILSGLILLAVARKPGRPAGS